MGRLIYGPTTTINLSEKRLFKTQAVFQRLNDGDSDPITFDITVNGESYFLIYTHGVPLQFIYEEGDTPQLDEDEREELRNVLALARKDRIITVA